VKKYLRIFAFAARDQLIYMPAFLARNVLFVFIMFTFYSLWRVVFSGRAALEGFTLTQTLWYLTFTETVELSRSRLHIQIQEEVKDGTVSVNLCRPYSYVAFHLFRSMGESAVKMVPIMLLGFVLALIFVGPLPGYFHSLPFGLLLILCGLVVGNLWVLAIGLLAFWTEEVSPLFWIMQKLVFILGGMFIPIDLFPKGLAAVARFLPFAFSAYWPAATMVRFSAQTFLTGLSGAFIYIGVLGAAVVGLFALGKRRIHANGG
jgi:ABC-2 type transport system permease protein